MRLLAFDAAVYAMSGTDLAWAGTDKSDAAPRLVLIDAGTGIWLCWHSDLRVCCYAAGWYCRAGMLLRGWYCRLVLTCGYGGTSRVRSTLPRMRLAPAAPARLATSCYGYAGTDGAYGATRARTLCSVPCARPTRTAPVSSAICLRAQYAMSGTESAYAATHVLHCTMSRTVLTLRTESEYAATRVLRSVRY
eukprot:431673-Rhodomonas_salina.3